MQTMRILALLGLLASSGVAQSMSLSALTAMPVLAQALALPQTATLSAGALQPTGSVGAVAGGGTHALLSWVASASDVRMSFLASIDCAVGSAGLLSTVGAGDLLVSLSLPVATPVNLRLVPTISGPAGASIPLLRVDVGNNGSIEMSEMDAATGGVGIPVTVGPVPLPIKVSLAASIAVPGTMAALVTIDAEPQNGTQVFPVYPGCGGHPYEVRETFGGDLRCWTTTSFPPLPNTASVLLFGLTPQVVPFGSSPYGPCLVVPSPDVLFFAPGTTSVFLSIPAAVRPITIFTQAVMLQGSPLWMQPTNAAQVLAL